MRQVFPSRGEDSTLFVAAVGTVFVAVAVKAFVEHKTVVARESVVRLDGQFGRQCDQVFRLATRGPRQLEGGVIGCGADGLAQDTESFTHHA